MKLVAALLLLAASAAHAQMYKCTDERGVVQYTDKATAGCKQVAIRASPPISGSLTPPADDLARREAEFRKRQIDRDASMTQAREALFGRCVQLRREQGVLATSRRVVRSRASPVDGPYRVASHGTAGCSPSIHRVTAHFSG